MANIPRKIIGNIEINKGSILLLFNEHDAEIVRNWRIIVKPDDIIDLGDVLPS
jgi:calcineurin-like phosphoesterase family protein